MYNKLQEKSSTSGYTKSQDDGGVVNLGTPERQMDKKSSSILKLNSNFSKPNTAAHNKRQKKVDIIDSATVGAPGTD